MGRFFTELWRRKVVQFSLGYLVAGWLVIQIAIGVFPELGLPDWADALAIVLVVLGFPLVIIVAWAQETQAAGDQNDPVTADPSIKGGGEARLAVLPFDNLSDDAEQDHLADGIVEDIITHASRLPRLAVVARNSTFAYKGQNPDIRQVGRDLDVHYVLEGSLRKMGGNVRITAQLNEAATGTHLWSESYDHPLDEIFEAQDGVVNAITDALGALVREAEVARASDTPLDELDDATLINRLRRYPGAVRQGEDMTEYDRLLEIALPRAENNPELLAIAALCKSVGRIVAADSQAADLLEEQAISMARDAARRAGNDASVLYFAGGAMSQTSAVGEAIRLLERSLELAPNNVLATLALGGARVRTGAFAEGVAMIREAMARDQHAIPGVGLGLFWQNKSEGEAALGNFDQAIDDCLESLRAVKEPGYRGWMLAGYYNMAGKDDEARSAARQAHVTWPHLKRAAVEDTIHTNVPEVLHAPLLATIDELWDDTA